VRDLAWAQRAVLDAMGIGHLRAVIGPSMGGMVALQWAIEYPGQADLVVAVSAPMTFTPAQRAGMLASSMAITSDPSWMFGEYADHGVQPVVGMAMAQQGLATLSQGRLLLFALGWTSYVAQASRYDANHYLWLIDLHQGYALGAEQGGTAAALRRVRARVVLLGSSDDEFITPSSTRADGRALQAASVASRVEIFRGAHGHFSCIEDTAAFAGVLAAEVKRVTP
jgi:homoserine O-acetyltransferase